MGFRLCSHGARDRTRGNHSSCARGGSVGHQDGPALEGTAQGGGGVPGGVPEGLDRALSALDLVTRQASGTGWTEGFFQAK